MISERDIVVCQDAHMNEVYLGLYAIDDDGVPGSIVEERLHDQAVIEELVSSPGRFTAAGFGWDRYPALFVANEQYLAGRSRCHHPSARFLLAAGARLLESGAAVDPQDVVPAYLRQTVAQRPAC